MFIILSCNGNRSDRDYPVKVGGGIPGTCQGLNGIERMNCHFFHRWDWPIRRAYEPVYAVIFNFASGS